MGIKGGFIVELVLNIKNWTNKKGTEKKESMTSIRLIYPSYLKAHSYKFAIYLKVMSIMLQSINVGEAISKRNVYYTDVAFFKNQATVDQVIDNISNCLGVAIENLGINASQKGLLWGNLEISLNEGGTTYKFSEEQGDALIPLLPSNLITEKIHFKFNPIGRPSRIIIVEKDAVFQSLIKLRKGRNELLITGKGFPDRLTKKFVHIVTKYFKDVPVFAFVDADVYGLMIVSEYMVKRMSDSVLSSCCERIQYAGVTLFRSGLTMEESCPRPQSHQISPFEYQTIGKREITIIKNFLLLLSQLKFENQLTIKSIYRMRREAQRGFFFQLRREMEAVEVTRNENLRSQAF